MEAACIRPRAAAVVALVERRAAVRDRPGGDRPAVIGDRPEQRVLVDLVAGAVEAALVEAVEVVAVGGERLAAVLEPRLGVTAAHDRVLEVDG